LHSNTFSALANTHQKEPETRQNKQCNSSLKISLFSKKNVIWQHTMPSTALSAHGHCHRRWNNFKTRQPKKWMERRMHLPRGKRRHIFCPVRALGQCWIHILQHQGSQKTALPTYWQCNIIGEVTSNQRESNGNFKVYLMGL
jgi:hypothetical protein